jgi:hydrogenase nickel incorporation protein HypB
MKVEVLKRVLEKNEQAAGEVRQLLDRHKVVSINMMGSPGCGKTTLLEATVKRLGADLRCGVLEGDLATTRDADRIAATDVPVVQVLTEGGCHLDATTVSAALAKLPLADLDLLFIENVGNLVCPANFELGESRRVVVLSVAEGDDKPMKYPYMFQRADAVVVSKIDLLEHCRFNLERVREDLGRVNPRAPVLEVSAYDGAGIDAWTGWVRRSVSG